MTDATFSNLKVRRDTASAVEDLLMLDSVSASAGNGSAISFITNSATEGLYLTLGRLSVSWAASAARLDIGVARDPTLSSGDDVPPLLSLVSDATGQHVMTAAASALAVGGTLAVAGATSLSSGLRVTGNLDVTGRVDGRDVSADGTRLDQHIANTTNPHNTTATQVGALPIGGGSISGGLNITGNVGIGTTMPGAKLNVDPQGAGGIVIGNPSTGSGGFTSLIMTINAASGGRAEIQAIKASGTEWGDIALNPNAGNVGIGITAPRAKLDVGGEILLSGNYSITTRRGMLFFGTSDGSGAARSEVVGAIGFWGFGIQHGQISFRAGDGFELVDRSRDGPSLSYSRDSYPYANLKVNRLSEASSLEWKENLTDLSIQEAVAVLGGLAPVKFNYRDDHNKRLYSGFIAEEVPDLVASAEHKHLNALSIVAVLTKVVKEQQQTIADLSTRTQILEELMR